MFINQLQIKNFKCFTDITIDNISKPNGSRGSGLNILIGENGNGKTTLLEAINYLTLNSYSVENKLSINDFTNYKEIINIIAEIDEFKCNSTIEYYKTYHFISSGIEFSAKSRTSKERNKLLSKPFESHSYFKINSQYKDVNGNDKKESIRSYVDTELLAGDSSFLRDEIYDMTPDLDMTFAYESSNGEIEELDIPIDISFFFPNRRR